MINRLNYMKRNQSILLCARKMFIVSHKRMGYHVVKQNKRKTLDRLILMARFQVSIRNIT